MQVTIRQEAGFDLSLYGFSLSYKDRAIEPEDWWCDAHTCHSCGNRGFREKDDIVLGCPTGAESCKNCEIKHRMDRIEKTAIANAGRGKGHDKWLRQVMLWIDVEAPLSWWKQMDQYKVGTVSQSESSMHCLHKRDITKDDCESTVIPELIDIFNAFKNGTKRSTEELNDNLPLGYKQRRLVTLNYQNLRDMVIQRKHHKLKYWVNDFIDSIYKQIEHPELLPKREEDK